MLSVVVPASSRRLTTLAAVWQDLALVTGPADPYLGALIDQASDAVQTFCGRDLGVQGYLETFRAFGDLVLGAFPLVAVSGITVDGTAIDLGCVSIDMRSGIVAIPRRGLCSSSRGEVAVSYSAGYVLPDALAPAVRTLPSDVERAALMMVKSASMAQTRDPALRSEDVTGIGIQTYGLSGMNRDGKLPPDVEGLLQRYRAVTVG